ncbi:PhzF family phenazine biosynthesis protein [Acidisoma cellulosilytica]|uniref:PhzF family phenazine biosynthesis protein n=1 Tax=Acidisoma cellulosilyticum TaxID=2802395 RepID=A0A964E293_9PROT|nr:PhzF family phenazine biosynthesis protein [Acidisoma cellulosilyticum]MCB8879044.1 PhzF family phenazine biosynthesis protein [Acidisoma cellulosilyticum]
MNRPFRLVDVFGRDDFSGNPLAVIADAEGLDTETMQRITRWLNLSETTFLLPPTTSEADYRVRIFTLTRELPFAGHPTLGTCHAWLEAGGKPRTSGRIVQECGAGLITVRQSEQGLAFAAPPLLRFGPPSEAEIAEIADFLNIGRDAIVEAAWIDNGPGWIGIMLGSAGEVLALQPKRHHARSIEVGVVGPHSIGQEAAFEVRALFTDTQGAVIEDPVTGSLNASVAQWLYASGRVDGPYIAAQGTVLGRTGRVQIERDGDGQIWVGGATRTLFSGQS